MTDQLAQPKQPRLPDTQRGFASAWGAMVSALGGLVAGTAVFLPWESHPLPEEFRSAAFTQTGFELGRGIVLLTLALTVVALSILVMLVSHGVRRRLGVAISAIGGTMLLGTWLFGLDPETAAYGVFVAMAAAIAPVAGGLLIVKQAGGGVMRRGDGTGIDSPSPTRLPWGGMLAVAGAVVGIKFAFFILLWPSLAIVVLGVLAMTRRSGGARTALGAALIALGALMLVVVAFAVAGGWIIGFPVVLALLGATLSVLGGLLAVSEGRRLETTQVEA